MRILITWGSKRGGTEGIARMLGEALHRDGLEVVLRPARQVGRIDGFDAVIVGGALYANRWHRDARTFVTRHLRALHRVPVWMFSSGPLDDSADRAEIAPPAQVQALMERAGALGHRTFGGRLAADAEGLAAREMAKKLAGDWRNPARIAAWADELARALPSARPGLVVTPPGSGWGRVLGHAISGWTMGAAVMATILSVTAVGAALVVHAIAAPLIFARVAWGYFELRGARAPLPTALTFAGVAAALDTALFEVLAPGRVGGIAATWVPLASIIAVTLAIGALRSTMPWPKPAPSSMSPDAAASSVGPVGAGLPGTRLASRGSP